MLSRFFVAAALTICCVAGAQAAIYEVTYIGTTYSPQNFDASFDNQNLFGGGNLANKTITVSYTYDTSLAPIQNNPSPVNNNTIAGAVTEVEITIGGTTQNVTGPFAASLILNYNDNLDFEPSAGRSFNKLLQH